MWAHLNAHLLENVELFRIIFWLFFYCFCFIHLGNYCLIILYKQERYTFINSNLFFACCRENMTSISKRLIWYITLWLHFLTDNIYTHSQSLLEFYAASLYTRRFAPCLLRQNNMRGWQRFKIPITWKTILKEPFLCFSFAHPFVRRSIHKRLACVRQKPLFNCVGVVHSFRHVYILIILVRIMLWLCFLRANFMLVSCWFPAECRYAQRETSSTFNTYSAKRLTQFRDVSPSKSGVSASTLCAIPLTMLLKALLNKLSSANCAFERFQVKILHENINFISPFSEAAARKFHFESIDYPQTCRALVCSLHGFKESL